VASLWCLLTKGIHAGQGPTCKRPLVLCPSSLVQNWGKVGGWTFGAGPGWLGWVEHLTWRITDRSTKPLIHPLQEFARWLGDRVQPVVVDDTRAAAVKDALQQFRGFARPGGKPRVL